MKRNSKIEIESIGDDVVSENQVSGYAQEYKLCDSSTLKDTLKPLFLTMRIMGLIYGNAFQAAGSKKSNCACVGCPDEIMDQKIENHSSNKKHHRKAWSHAWSHTWSHAFSVFNSAVVLLLVGHGIYEIAVSNSNAMEIMRMTFRCCFAILCALQHITCVFTASHRTKKNPNNKFDKFVKTMLLVRAESVLKTKSRVKRITVYGWIYMMIYALVFWVGVSLKDPDILGIFFGKSDFAITYSDKLIYPFVLMVPTLVATWALPTCFYISLCIVVSGCFDDLVNRSSSAIPEKKKLNLANLRREYVRLCNVLSALNDMLSPLGMVMFSIYLPLICLNINVGIDTFTYDSSVINKVAYISWIVLNSSILCLISMHGARVNESASRLSEVLYNIDIKELDEKSELELMLLLTNVNTNYAGLTVGGLVTITKEMILTVFGTIVGYLTILIQFK